MSRTGETKNTIAMSKFWNFEVSKWVSYLYMTRNYRGCRFDLKMPLSQYLQWLRSYKKISFRAEGGLHPLLPILHSQRANEALPSWNVDAK